MRLDVAVGCGDAWVLRKFVLIKKTSKAVRCWQ